MKPRPPLEHLAWACAAAVACSSCSSEGSAAGPTCGATELLVAASDYSSSAVGGAPPSGRAALWIDPDLDPALALSNGRAFFLARDADLVIELDAACGAPRAKTSVHDLAPRDPRTGLTRPANPHDVAAAPDGTLLVALYDVGQIALLRAGAVVGTIDISRFDADGNPQAESIRVLPIDGVPKAFVALERLDDADFPKSKQPSMMLRIDVASRSVDYAVELAGRNPFNAMAEDGGGLFLAEPGDFDANDEPLAGIERFDTVAGTSRLLVAERDLGGSVAEVAVSGGCGAAIVAGPQKDVNPTSLVVFDAATGRVLQTLLGPTPGYDLQGLAWKGGTLYVGDRRLGADGYPIHALERDGNACTLHESTRTILLPQRPVALRPAG